MPPELGVAVYLFANQGEELAGKTINVTTNSDNPPRIEIRWKDELEQFIMKRITEDYALRLEFGEVANDHISGKIYLCLGDDAKSYVAGKFDAEIRVPERPRPIMRPPETSQTPIRPPPPKRPH